MVNTPNPSSGGWYDGIVLVRIPLGLLLLVNGWQLFGDEGVQGLRRLLFDMSIPFPEAMRYTEDLLGLAGGLLLIPGLFTRFITAILFVSFALMTFLVNDGRIFTTDEHSFVMALLSLVFVFAGAGRISADYLLFVNRKEDQRHSSTASAKFGRYVSKS